MYGSALFDSYGKGIPIHSCSQLLCTVKINLTYYIFLNKRSIYYTNNPVTVNNPNFELKEYGEGILDKDYTIKQQKYISECFYELLEVFNTMTCQNIVLGDVNGDGVVSVVDATLVQNSDC